MAWSRRQFLTASVAFPSVGAARPAGLLIDTHIHLFADDQRRFPYHRNATYRPPPAPLADYLRFVEQADIDHAVIVHPEPYQDDHRYLEYCFEREPRRGFFKGTCLFDPTAADTPVRMEALAKSLPGRIVALRIHVNRKRGELPTTSGAIRDRDLRHPAMTATWRKASDLGLAVQMHFIPHHAPEIGRLAREFSSTTVILDHLARAGEGTQAEFDEVLRLARLPRVVTKFSGVQYSSGEEHPHLDARPLVRRALDAFGAERMIWGGLGMAADEFEKRAAMLDLLFDFASESDRAAFGFR